MELLLPFLGEVLVILASVLATFLIALINKHIGKERVKKINEELWIIREVVALGVKYAEQKFNSGEKFDKAMEWIVEELEKKNIKADRKQIEGIIEATIREFKDTFGEGWANNLDKKEEV